MFIHGDSTEKDLVAIIAPEPEPFAAFASETLRRHIAPKELPSVYNDPVLPKALLKELESFARRKKLQGFERIKGVHLATEPFSVENELLTPPLKLKRAAATKAFRAEINKLYGELHEKDVAVKSKL